MISESLFTTAIHHHICYRCVVTLLTASPPGGYSSVCPADSSQVPEQLLTVKAIAYRVVISLCYFGLNNHCERRLSTDAISLNTHAFKLMITTALKRLMCFYRYGQVAILMHDSALPQHVWEEAGNGGFLTSENVAILWGKLKMKQAQDLQGAQRNKNSYRRHETKNI